MSQAISSFFGVSREASILLPAAHKKNCKKSCVNIHWLTTAVAGSAAALIIGLNAFLIWQTVTGA